ETHRPFPEVSQAHSRYCLPPEPLPDTAETRADMAGFKVLAMRLDEKIGQIIEALRRNKFLGKTLIICTTDHGPAFPRMKCTLYDGGIRVMLIIHGPDIFSGGKVVNGLVSQVDIFPTLGQYLSLPLPDWLAGVSFLPLLTGQSAVREEVFAEINYHAAYEPGRCIRTTRYKYIKRYHDHLTPVLPNTDRGLAKLLWLKHGWKEERIPREELYDLIFDPNEKNNLVHSVEFSQIINQLRKKMEEWMKQTDDPLITGDIPLPATARLNPQDGMDPDEPTLEAGKR
ncbi:MAG: sulfatase-like hydrolase/transferase, partial [Candidatus Omnitrophica bacterium]|nr:sulfatase-like hydrolase/transferase [Candidatus Omnitrophota bacterium]